MPQIRDRRAAAFAAVLACLGTGTIVLGLRTEDGLPSPPVQAAAPPVHAPSVPARSVPALVTSPSAAPPRGMKPSPPVRLQIPAIKVDTEVMALGLRDDGTLEVPPLRGDAPAGWYRHSPTPGEPGASVLAGHVDTARDGPAVFFRLRELKVKDSIAVRRKDGTVARFEVSRVATYPKRDFPSREVYAPLASPGLRLITCGGVFDRGEGSYRSNVVVYADPVT
jgi:sortase (surface protein transpeptidase)